MEQILTTLGSPRNRKAPIGMKRVACGLVAQKRAAVFGGEDQMNVNSGKGLWHGGRMVNGGGVFQSQRDYVHQPKGCEERATLGEHGSSVTTPTGLRCSGE